MLFGARCDRLRRIRDSLGLVWFVLGSLGAFLCVFEIVLGVIGVFVRLLELFWSFLELF